MSKHTLGTHLITRVKKNMETVGEQIRLARLRRKLPLSLIAARATISTVTAAKVEKGDPTVSIGIYARVLLALGLEDTITEIAKNDPLGILYMENDLPLRRRAPKEKKKDGKN